MRALLLVVSLVLVCAWPRAAHADLSQARLAIGTGLRLNFGDLGDDFAWGWQIVDVQAALQPIKLFRGFVRTGPAWWTTVARYGASSATAVDQQLSTLQMGLGWRVASALPIYGYPFSVHAQAGGQFMRTSHPVPPDDTDTYWGVNVQLGLEYGSGAAFWGVQAKYDVPGFGPQGVYVLVYVGLGN